MQSQADNHENAQLTEAGDTCTDDQHQDLGAMEFGDVIVLRIEPCNGAFQRLLFMSPILTLIHTLLSSVFRVVVFRVSSHPQGIRLDAS